MNKKVAAERKTHRINCQLNDRDYVEFKSRLAKTNMTQQDYIYKAVMNGRILSTDGLKELLPQISRIGGNINQIAYRLNTGETPNKNIEDSILLIQLGLEDTWQLLKQSLHELNSPQ